MRRRSFLRSTASVAALLAASGCLEAEIEAAEHQPEPLSDAVSPAAIDLPVEQRSEVAAAAIERAEASDVTDRDALESFLAENGLEVESLEETESGGEQIVELEYVDEASADRGYLHGLGLVAGGYAALVAADNEGERLHATIVDASGRTFGEFEVQRHWAEEYDEGALTAREYASEVVTTAATTTD